MTSKSKIILSLLAAAAAGAAMGVLLAPTKGSDLRKKVKDTANGWANDLADLLDLKQKRIKEAYINEKPAMVDRVRKR